MKRLLCALIFGSIGYFIGVGENGQEMCVNTASKACMSSDAPKSIALILKEATS